nr:MAG TPA: hypothetical protein [Caudoviricetes sp.]
MAFANISLSQRLLWSIEIHIHVGVHLGVDSCSMK